MVDGSSNGSYVPDVTVVVFLALLFSSTVCEALVIASVEEETMAGKSVFTVFCKFPETL